MVDDAVKWVVHPLPSEGQDHGGHRDGNQHCGAEEKAARKFFVEDQCSCHRHKEHPSYADYRPVNGLDYCQLKPWDAHVSYQDLAVIREPDELGGIRDPADAGKRVPDTTDKGIYGK